MAQLTYTADDPRNPSASYRAQSQAYRLVEAAHGGAAHVRGMREAFLPKYTAETWDEYARRVASAPWRPEFVDCLRNIAAKPFSKPVSLQGTVPAPIKTFAEDVDTLKNSLHVFSAYAFWMGVSYGLHGILVDYPSMQPGLTLADERRAGARPYWVHVPAQSLLALQTQIVRGENIVTHARIREVEIAPSGRFGERTVERVRVLEPGHWELWEVNDKGDIVQVAEGVIALDRVPLALFYTGHRSGCGSHPRPPLVDLADVQMELYRALSREDEVLTFAGSPMLKAVGLGPPENGGTVEIGPKRILYAPNNGSGQTDWDFIQPNPGNLAEIRAKIQSIVDDIRRLGLQPLLPRTGDITATSSAIEASKAHSAVQAWAGALQDALETALVYTAQWLGVEQSAEVSVHSDFAADITGTQDIDALSKMQAMGQISKQTLYEECLRRGFLGPQFSPDVEADRLENEMSDQPIVQSGNLPANDQLAA